MLQEIGKRSRFSPKL